MEHTMNSRKSWLCAGAWLLVACGGANDAGQPNMFPVSAGSAAMPLPAGAMGITPPVTVPPGNEAGSAGTATAGTMAPVIGGMDGAQPPFGGSAGQPPGGSGGDEPVPPAEPSGPLLPIIPPVMGECPSFTSGTKTIMGLSGISFQVGAKVEGTPTGALVFYWHGTGSTAAEGNRFPGIRELMATGGIFVAFSRSTRSGGDCSGTNTFTHDDFKIADQIVACAVRDHNIDARRIYATGCSAGGLFSGCMAIERSSYLAATVPNSGGITIGYGPIQDPTRVPAVMTMHGGSSDVVIVTFSQTSQAYASHMLKKGSPMVINCDHRGGHCAAPAALYESGWQFMKDHPFGTKPSPYENGLPAGFHSSCKIWTDDSLTPLGRDPTGEPKVPVTGTPWMPPEP
jgi:hypothetical protein